MFKGKKRRLLIFAGIFFLTVIQYYKVLDYSFFQDDFFVLFNTRINSMSEFWKLLLPQDGVVYYRPIGIQMYFGLMQLAGLVKSWQFHLISLLTHLLNIVLVYKLSNRWFQNEKIAEITAFFYAVSPIHYLALGWAVNYSFILSATWILLSLICYLDGRWRSVLILMLLALLTNEISVILPGLLLLSVIRERKNINKKKVWTILATAVISVIYVVIRVKFGMKMEGVYSLSIGASLQSLRWYLLWILGWVDSVKDYMIGPLSFRWDFVYYFQRLWLVYLIELGGLMSLIAIWLMRAIRNNKLKKKINLLAMGLLWILVSLLPVLFFKDHIYSHYATVASLGLYWILAQILSDPVWKKRKLLLLISGGFWLLISWETTKFNLLASWLGDHARYSRMAQDRMFKEYRSLPKEGKIYIEDLTGKARVVLSEGMALGMIYNINPERVVIINNVKEIPELSGYLEKFNDEEKVNLEVEQIPEKVFEENGVIVFSL